MKALLIFLSFIIIIPAFGQAPRRSMFGGPTVVSPDVQSDGSVTFRLIAANAKQVSLNMAGSPAQPMQKDANGVWSVTTGKLAPDVYPYSFVVDSVIVPDPSNPALKPIYRTSLGQSLVHVPGPATLSWEVNDVPHGAVSHRFYKSGIIGDDRDYFVYTPPGYDAKRKKPYPVLYLFHGVTDDASAWTVAGRANFILDNLIAEGKAEPMIVVNTLGYGKPDNIMSGYGGPFEKFEKALLEEVIPSVEKEYNASTDASMRAIAGLSMGGAESLFIGLNNTDKFKYIGGFSSAVVMYGIPMNNQSAPGTNAASIAVYNKVFPNLTDKVNSDVKILWISCGTEDFLVNSNADFKKWLATKNVKYTEILTPGAHTWMVWRRNLTAFAPLLFK